VKKKMYFSRISFNTRHSENFHLKAASLNCMHVLFFFFGKATFDINKIHTKFWSANPEEDMIGRSWPM
jgi:hypothetical protein